MYDYRYCYYCYCYCYCYYYYYYCIIIIITSVGSIIFRLSIIVALHELPFSIGNHHKHIKINKYSLLLYLDIFFHSWRFDRS